MAWASGHQGGLAGAQVKPSRPGGPAVLPLGWGRGVFQRVWSASGASGQNDDRVEQNVAGPFPHRFLLVMLSMDRQTLRTCVL